VLFVFIWKGVLLAILNVFGVEYRGVIVDLYGIFRRVFV